MICLPVIVLLRVLMAMYRVWGCEGKGLWGAAASAATAGRQRRQHPCHLQLCSMLAPPVMLAWRV